MNFKNSNKTKSSRTHKNKIKGKEKIEKVITGKYWK